MLKKNEGSKIQDTERRTWKSRDLDMVDNNQQDEEVPSAGREAMKEAVREKNEAHGLNESADKKGRIHQDRRIKRTGRYNIGAKTDNDSNFDDREPRNRENWRNKQWMVDNLRSCR